MENLKISQLFVGEKYEKLYNKNFSFWTLLFGPFYFIYRKMIFSGAIISLIQILICSFLSYRNSVLSFIAFLLINIAASFLFNSMYRKFVENKVKKISQMSNSDDNIRTLCIKKGQTSVTLFFISMIIYIIIFIITHLALGVIFTINSVVSDIEDNLGIDLSSDSKIIISDTGRIVISGMNDNDIKKCISYELNNRFKEDSFWNGTFTYKDGDEGIFNDVKFSVYGAKDLELDKIEKLKSKSYSTNGKTWNILYNDDSSNERIHAYIKINNIYILFEYEIGEDVKDKETAKQYFVDILNSVKYNK